jgi:hypothetical protein
MKPMLIVLSIVALTASAICFPWIFAARASSNLVLQAVNMKSCVNRYNYLLNGAKAALIKGDRVTSVQLLEQAENLIAGCPALQDGSSRPITLLALNTGDSLRVN